MIRASELVTIQQKEYAALTTMRLMLNDYAAQQGVSFDEAIGRFASSAAYDALFDYETGLWREGPDYLRAFWMACDRAE